jgi:pimeloyl-ACP methyl ester carboxylesterase
MLLTQTAAVDGGLVAWDVVGDGAPVVLVHGFPARGYLWRGVIPALASAGCRVFVYDLLGFGSSEQRDGQELYFEGQARVLDALLGQWGLNNPTVVAHDMGTGVAVVTVTEYARTFERLVLVSAAICPPAVTGGTLHVQRHINAYATMPAATWAPMVRAKVATATHIPMDAATIEAYAAPWLGARGQAAYLRLVEQIDEALVERTYTALERLDMPVKVIWGEEDTWLPVEQAERVAKRVAKADLSIVPGGGHFLPEDAPGAVGRLLCELF